MHTKRTIIIATISLCFFLATAGGLGVFAYMVEKQKEEYHTKNAERALLESRQQALLALEKTLNETKAEREFLNTLILREDQVITLLTQIETIGRGQGVKLTTNSLTEQPVNEQFETLVVNVTVSGSYQGVMQVFKILEHLPYQSSLANVRMERVDEGGLNEWKSSYEIRVTKFKK